MIFLLFLTVDTGGYIRGDDVGRSGGDTAGCKSEEMVTLF